MTRLFHLLFCLAVFFSSCDNKVPHNKSDPTNVAVTNNMSRLESLKGTWILHEKRGFALIEIQDSSHILYYRMIDRKAEIDTIKDDRYWYYKSNAKMGYLDSSAIWIATDKFRFDFKLKGDTLIEFDKMGDRGKFIKVYTEEQKATKDF